MEFAPWMANRRNPRRGRFDTTHNEDAVHIDVTQDAHAVAKTILVALSERDLSEGRILSYLNNFVKLLLHASSRNATLGFTNEELLYCLRYFVTHEAAAVRAGAFRAIRHLIAKEEDVDCLNDLLIPYLIVRCLDVEFKHNAIRVEAIKLTRKAMLIAPDRFPTALSRYLVSVASCEQEVKDRMLRAYLAILCELGALNPFAFINAGGVAAITRNLLECQTPKISESLCGVLLLLLDKPSTRRHAGIDLHCVAAPYCDFHYRHGWMDKHRDERELKFNCSRLVLLSIFRSWPGIMHFCNPTDTSGLKAIVDVLYLNQLEVRKAVLDLLYELLNLPQPEWTDELSVALSAVDPAEPQVAWRLGEGFVAAEGRSILPHLARTTPNIGDMHLSLLIYCFLETGLLGALSEVIATSDTFISVRATVLLGELLRLIHVLLPPECCNITPPLPDLIKYATTNRPQALCAITALQQLHKLLKRRPASHSLHLDFILRSGSTMQTHRLDRRLAKRHRYAAVAKSKLAHLMHSNMDSSSSSSMKDAVKESGVLLNKDALKWNWIVIQIILKRESNFKIDLSDANHRTFLKRLVEYFVPSNNRYSHMDLSPPKNPQGYTMAGLDLVYRLTHWKHPYSLRLLIDLIRDIAMQIDSIKQGAHGCLFSPQHMGRTQCQSYFLFIGRLATYPQGAEILDSFNLCEKLKELATTTNHDCYVKLIISSLDYADNVKSTEILAAVLNCSNELSRLYATQFLLVLLRAGVPNFATWGIRLLAKQLEDKSRLVYLSALSTLHEACEIETNINSLVEVNPPLFHLQERGAMLLIRYLSIPIGFNHLNKNNFVVNELKRWDAYFNNRYVFIVESEAADALTLHQRGADGRYDKRQSTTPTMRQDLFLPPHLYGQLAKHSEGMMILLQHGNISHFLQTIEYAQGASESDEEILQIKSALWALGHFCTSRDGLEFVTKQRALRFIVDLAEKCVVWSIKATAFYTLGLVATTDFGADCLFKLGWVSTRHDRHDRWPVIQGEHWKLNQELAIDLIHQTLADDDTTDDDSSIVEDDLLPPDAGACRKSSTLPRSYYPASQCARSSSESKAFEYFRNRARLLRLDSLPSYRNRNSVESTTSGVDISEGAIAMGVTSSVPPSAGRHGMKPRRHSESSRTRLHSERTQPSTASLGSNSSKLGFQDYMGYQIMRQIKLQDKAACNDELDSIGAEMPSLWPSLSERKRFFSESADRSSMLHFIRDGLSLTSLSSMKKFQMHSPRNQAVPLHMGIALPASLNKLFPVAELALPLQRDCDERYRMEAEKRFACNTQGSSKTKSRFVHVARLCFKCSNRRTRCKQRRDDATSSLTIEKEAGAAISDASELNRSVLSQIEMLSNPLVLKHFKQNLLNMKQKHANVFRDICLYSDVCRVLSQNNFQPAVRRFVQDVFHDITFAILAPDMDALLASTDRQTCSPQHCTNERVERIAAFRRDLTTQRRKELQHIAERNDSNVKLAREADRKDSQQVDLKSLKADDEQLLSPPRYHASPPPLTSVAEENVVSSSENILDVQVGPQISNKSVFEGSNILTLDQLKLTCNENKFPIKRDEKHIVK